MKKISLNEHRDFADKGMKKHLVHDSYNFKILNFNFRAGQELAVHSHDLDGELSIVVIEGEGWFLSGTLETMEAREGDVLVSEIREPHGVRAKTDMRVLVTIAPPI